MYSYVIYNNIKRKKECSKMWSVSIKKYLADNYFVKTLNFDLQGDRIG